jgi:hypothetical protein
MYSDGSRWFPFFKKKDNLELPLNVLMNTNVQCCGSTVSTSMTKYVYKKS